MEEEEESVVPNTVRFSFSVNARGAKAKKSSSPTVVILQTVPLSEDWVTNKCLGVIEALSIFDDGASSTIEVNLDDALCFEVNQDAIFWFVSIINAEFLLSSTKDIEDCAERKKRREKASKYVRDAIERTESYLSKKRTVASKIFWDHFNALFQWTRSKRLINAANEMIAYNCALKKDVYKTLLGPEKMIQYFSPDYAAGERPFVPPMTYTGLAVLVETAKDYVKDIAPPYHSSYSLFDYERFRVFKLKKSINPRSIKPPEIDGNRKRIKISDALAKGVCGVDEMRKYIGLKTIHVRDHGEYLGHYRSFRGTYDFDAQVYVNAKETLDICCYAYLVERFQKEVANDLEFIELLFGFVDLESLSMIVKRMDFQILFELQKRHALSRYSKFVRSKYNNFVFLRILQTVIQMNSNANRIIQLFEFLMANLDLKKLNRSIDLLDEDKESYFGMSSIESQCLKRTSSWRNVVGEWATLFALTFRKYVLNAEVICDWFLEHADMDEETIKYLRYARVSKNTPMSAIEVQLAEAVAENGSKELDVFFAFALVNENEAISEQIAERKRASSESPRYSHVCMFDADWFLMRHMASDIEKGLCDLQEVVNQSSIFMSKKCISFLLDNVEDKGLLKISNDSFSLGQALYSYDIDIEGKGDQRIAFYYEFKDVFDRCIDSDAFLTKEACTKIFTEILHRNANGELLDDAFYQRMLDCREMDAESVLKIVKSFIEYVHLLNKAVHVLPRIFKACEGRFSHAEIAFATFSVLRDCTIIQFNSFERVMKEIGIEFAQPKFH